jgi:diguanylate cyclase (GGDEF)-like protein
VDDKLWREHRAQLQAHEVFHNFEIQRRKPSGEWMWVSVSGEPIFDKQGQFAGYRGIGRDITAQKRAEAEIQRLAFYDELTGLPNRRLLLDRLERRHQCPQRHPRGLLFSTWTTSRASTTPGTMGDRLLTLVAQRLTASVRASDTVARLGGDDLCWCCKGCSRAHRSGGEAELVAQKVLQELSRPYTLEDAVLYSTPSIGITLFRNQEQSVHELLKRADLAMYQAKAQGRNTLCFLTRPCRRRHRRSALEGDMRLG